MVDELEVRRKRALFRATHRGTMEMDWLLGRYAEARLDGMDFEALEFFEAFLRLPDPELQNMILNKDDVSHPEYQTLVRKLRDFHGIGA